MPSLKDFADKLNHSLVSDDKVRSTPSASAAPAPAADYFKGVTAHAHAYTGDAKLVDAPIKKFAYNLNPSLVSDEKAWHTPSAIGEVASAADCFKDASARAYPGKVNLFGAPENVGLEIKSDNKTSAKLTSAVPINTNTKTIGVSQVK